jgi:hypothetical protein
VNDVIYVRDLAFYLAMAPNSPVYNKNDANLYYFTDLNNNVLDNVTWSLSGKFWKPVLV